MQLSNQRDDLDDGCHGLECFDTLTTWTDKQQTPAPATGQRRLVAELPAHDTTR